MMSLRVLIPKRLAMTILIVCIGCSLLLALPHTQGQSGRLKKLLPSVQVSYFEWARDSRSFAYSLDSPEVRDSFNSERFWTHYNLDTETFVESSTYPFLPQLTPQEETTFVRTTNTFSYLSPDGRYLLYAGEIKYEGVETRYWTLMIGDRQSQSTLALPYPLFQPQSKIGAFDVKWAQDSRSVILEICSNPIYCDPSFVIHIRGLESGLSGLVIDDTNISNPVLEGVEYQTLGLIDFSGDGTWAVLGVGEDYGLGASHLMMYNLVNPQSSVLVTEPIGQFATPDGSKMLYINDQGIYRYDWANHTSTLLTTEVNNAIAFQGAFSPDGRWFVFDSWSSELYLYDLQGLPEAPMPTAIAPPPGEGGE